MARTIDAYNLNNDFVELYNGLTDEKEKSVLRRVMQRVNQAPTLTPPNEPERAGLYGKYTVYKNKDGSLVTDCFILRPAKDPAAVAALRAYAATTDNAELAADIINWVGAEPNEWVSVEEGLPKEKQRVIVRCERVGTSVGWILWGNWMTDIGPDAGKVTHWMSLPAPPEKEDQK